VANQEAIAQIRQYLETNKEHYERAALRSKLYEKGYSPSDIDAAEALVFAAANPVASRAPFALSLLGVLFVNIVVIPGTIILFLANSTDYPAAGLVLLVLLPIELIVALLIRTTQRGNDLAEMSRGVLWALGISAIPYGAIALLAGACLGCIALYS
jgi:hypothetical protein